jgi:hypothetical protein
LLLLSLDIFSFFLFVPSWFDSVETIDDEDSDGVLQRESGHCAGNVCQQYAMNTFSSSFFFFFSFLSWRFLLTCLEPEDVPEKFWEFLGSWAKKYDLEGWTRYRGDMRPPGMVWFDEWKGIESMSVLDAPLSFVSWRKEKFFFVSVVCWCRCFVSCFDFLLFSRVVVYHISPIMNSEEKRRLLGNDVAMIFYYDAPWTAKPFDLSGILTFGEVPQVFAVLQPNDNNEFRYAAIFSSLLFLF